MKVKESLKLNRFREVAIPTKGEYMKRFGAINTPLNYSGTEPAPSGNERKTEAMELYDQYAKQMEKEAANTKPKNGE